MEGINVELLSQLYGMSNSIDITNAHVMMRTSQAIKTWNSLCSVFMSKFKGT